MSIERNPNYWATPAHLERVEFKVIPDATTRALELRKHSADVAINSLTADTVLALRKDPGLTVIQAPGTIYAYIALNLRDPILKDVRVRHALAHAIDVQPIIHYLLRNQAQPAYSILPPEHWAYDGDVQRYPYDPAQARQILDDAGYSAKDGVRFHVAMKSSTDDATRLMTVVLQQQLREVGIALDIRTYEFATFFSDITKGAYQMYSMRWIGGNQDPDIFEYVFDSASFPPKRANRTFYSNPRVDELIREGRTTLDQEKRKVIYAEIQRILAEELPYINLWYLDNVLVHTNRVRGITVSPAGNYDFLKTAELARLIDWKSQPKPRLDCVVPSNFGTHLEHIRGDSSALRILFVGDIFARPGRTIVHERLPELQKQYGVELTVANGENAAGGFGITPQIAEELFELGIDVITTGNHVWDKREIIDYLNSANGNEASLARRVCVQRTIRPAVRALAGIRDAPAVASTMP